jgi:hypothetical protein
VERTVANREHIWQAGAALRVHGDAVSSESAGLQQRLNGGHDANPHDDDISRDKTAVSQAHALHAFACRLDGIHSDAQPDVDALGAVLRLKKARQRLSGDTGEHPVERLENSHLLAELDEYRGGFEAYVAAADHHHSGRAGKLIGHLVDVSAGANRMYAVETVTVARQPAGMPAGRPDQLAITKSSSVGERHLAPLRIDRYYLAAEPSRDASLVPEGGRTDHDTVEALLSRQVVLGQRRPFVRRLRLRADQADRACEILLAQHRRRLGAAVTRTHDQYINLNP